MAKALKDVAAVILAAGKSTRMKSDLPKVLHRLCGQPMLTYVLRALDDAGVQRKIVVVGHQAERVQAEYADWPGVEFVAQTEQKGTGHAVMMCKSALENHQGPVLVLAGDGPMVRAAMLKEMVRRLVEPQAAALLATAVVDDPFGMGRIVRDSKGEFESIVEQKDATSKQAKIGEINASYYCFDGPKLFWALDQVTDQNAQGEFYLTDVPGILKANGHIATAEILANTTDVYSINTRAHLAHAHALMQERVQDALLESGVTIVDPRSTFIDARAKIGRDTIIHPFTVVEGPVEIGTRCEIGPFAHVRQGTMMGTGVRLGAFVEVTRSQLGENVKALHHSYMGDAVIDAGANIGAGVITANFDGKTKSPTHVGTDAFLGSGVILVAPVSVGARAMVGAGAVVTRHHDVDEGQTVVGVPARPLPTQPVTND